MLEERFQTLRRKLMVLDAVLTVAAFLGAYGFRGALPGGEASDLLAYIGLVPLIAPLWIVVLSWSGAYGSLRMTARREYAWAVCRAVGVGVGLLLMLLFLLKIQYVSRLVIVIFALADVCLLTALRLYVVWRFRRSFERGENTKKVVIVGTGPRARRLAETLVRRMEWGIHIVGYLDPDPRVNGTRLLGGSVLGSIGEISAVLKNHVVDEVILAVPRTLIPEVEKVALVCQEEGVKFLLMADVFDVNVARMRAVQYGAIPLMSFEPVAQDEWKVLVKRMLDLGCSLLMLPLILPVMGLIALAIKLDSDGPVFFTQDRVGLNKRRFRMLKFRSMVQGSEKLMAQIEHLNEAKGPIFKIANDPRVTRVGRILRKTSLDELPQIFNIVKGDMSLVGPRPMSLRDVGLFDQGIQRKRFSVKPGLTCLWQVSGRSSLPFSKWLELDLSYIENWSLELDLKILLRTIPVVLRGTGAV